MPAPKSSWTPARSICCATRRSGGFWGVLLVRLRFGLGLGLDLGLDGLRLRSAAARTAPLGWRLGVVAVAIPCFFRLDGRRLGRLSLRRAAVVVAALAAPAPPGAPAAPLREVA